MRPVQKSSVKLRQKTQKQQSYQKNAFILNSYRQSNENR